MASIYFDGVGKVMSLSTFAFSDDNAPPAGAAGTVRYDETTNPDLASTILNAIGQFTVASGVLQRNGSPVTIAADSSTKQALDALLNGAQQAVTNNLTFLALSAPTNAQTLAQVQAVSRQVNQIIKRLVLLGRAVS